MAEVLAGYRLPPLIVPHYTAIAVVRQKIRALAAMLERVTRNAR